MLYSAIDTHFPHTWEAICNNLNSREAVIAGGFLRNMVENNKEFNDIDIFVSGREKLKEILSSLKAAAIADDKRGRFKVALGDPNYSDYGDIGVYKVQILSPGNGVLKIDLVLLPQHVEALNCYKKFDFSFNCFVWWGKDLKATIAASAWYVSKAVEQYVSEFPKGERGESIRKRFLKGNKIKEVEHLGELYTHKENLSDGTADMRATTLLLEGS